MLRTSQLKILCPICTKPDGCLVAEDGGAVICSRISEGAVKKVGKGGFCGGWLHITGDFNPKKYTVPPKLDIDWNHWSYMFAKELSDSRLEFAALCNEQKLNPISALRFYIGWTSGWLTIPIYGLKGKITGIQRRQGNTKRFMKHSSMGVFLPSAFLQNTEKTLAVCEGWTDTVTAVEYGYNAIGKMNCFVGDEEVVYYAKRSSCERVVVFADDDNGVGLEGAKATAEKLSDADLPTRIVMTPRKDLRQCKQDGMTIQEVFK